MVHGVKVVVSGAKVVVRGVEASREKQRGFHGATNGEESKCAWGAMMHSGEKRRRWTVEADAQWGAREGKGFRCLCRKYYIDYNSNRSNI